MPGYVPHTPYRHIGAGNVAARHAEVLSGFSDVKIAGIADTDPPKGRDTGARHGSPAYGSHADLLEAGGLDAVYVCVPPFAHGNPELDILIVRSPDFCGEAAFAGPVHRGEDRRRDRPRAGCRPPSATTGVTWTLSTRHASCWPAAGTAGAGPLAGQGAPGRVVAGARNVGRPDRRAGGPRPRPGQSCWWAR